MDNKTNAQPTPPPYVPEYHMVFKSYTDPRIYILVAVILGLFQLIIPPSAPADVRLSSIYFESVVFVICILVLRAFWKNTTYTVNGNLLILSNTYTTLTIPIDCINSLKPRNILIRSMPTSPFKPLNYATSFRNIQIGFRLGGRSTFAYATPEDDELFISTLCAINPNIVVKK